jgi:lactoylglutathione lyase
MKKLFLLLFWLLSSISFPLAAQSASASDTASQQIYLNHIAMFVKDLKKSTTFYENVFQLKQIPEPFKDGLHTWFTLGAAGQIHLIQSVDPDIKRNKHDHICFSVRSIDEFIIRLDKEKIPYMNWAGTPQTVTTRVDGVKQVFFQDPDGHWIEVNDDFPGK